MPLEADQPPRDFTPLNWRHASPEAVLERIQSAKIVGMGGAGFPTHEKIRTALNRSQNIVVANGIECEPGVSADEELMLTRGPDVLEGLLIVAHCMSAERIFIATKSFDCYQKLANSAPKQIDVRLLSSTASQGEERVLIYRLTGIDIPIDVYPATEGIIVLNVATLFAVCEAVRDGLEPSRRIMTVVTKNQWVEFGTPIDSLVDSEFDVRLGGPITGKKVESKRVATDATSNAVSVLSRETPSPCIRCGWCNDVCPRDLPVLDLSLESLHAKADRHSSNDFNMCHECGACALTCPSRIRLVDYLREGKCASSEDLRSKDLAASALARYDRKLARNKHRSAQLESERNLRLRNPRNW